MAAAKYSSGLVSLKEMPLACETCFEAAPSSRPNKDFKASKYLVYSVER